MPGTTLRRVLCCLVLLLNCQACTIGKPQPSPDLGRLLPEEWQAVQGSGYSDGQPEREWWRQFNDPHLERLIDQLFTDSLALKAARQRISEAMARQGVVGADNQLQLVAALGYTTARTGDDTVTLQAIPPGRSIEVFSAGINSGWELDLWGRTARLLEAAEADVRFSYSEYHGMLVSLAAELAQHYFELQDLYATRQLVRETVALEETGLQLTASLQQAGSQSNLAVTTARLRLEDAASRLPAIDQRILATTHRIDILRGLPPGQAEVVADSSIASLPSLTGLGLPADLISRRPDITAAFNQYQAAMARLGAAEAERYPTLVISGSLTLSSDTLGKMLGTDSLFYSLGPSLSWPLLTGGRIESTIAVRQSQAEQARLTLEERLVAALSEVETAAGGAINSQQQVARLNSAEQEAGLNLALSEERFRSGLTNRFEVLESSRKLLSAREKLVNAKLSALAEVVNLYRALGGGWQTMAAGEMISAASLHTSTDGTYP